MFAKLAIPLPALAVTLAAKPASGGGHGGERESGGHGEHSGQIPALAAVVMEAVDIDNLNNHYWFWWQVVGYY